MKNSKTYQLALAALFAALSYAVFTFLQIKIPVGADMTSIHLGNAVVVLGAFIIGGPLGGIAGAIGMSIGDLLDPVYVPLVPKTLFCKLLIGLITGFVAHRIGGITTTDDPKHILRWTIIAAACGLIFNMFADPIIGYWYKILILGKPAADLSLKINFVATTINAVVSLVVSVAVYAALRPALQKAGFFMKLTH
ncbi:ECF transporter S component [Oribacterium sp. P9]|uniref:ECF transporter S component n=1 Tax=unclassified Oribacterium TaxID=2629782 RepID=UPI002A7B2429|nr:ECF transporter S component [Oribacterium sp.]MDD6519875.1 ECF transporter S component [Oribacterium sp.]MDY2854763.1 ECF transporter S component [Oliverpabstia sp.]